MNEKLYTESQVREAFLAGYKQAVEDPVRCRPSEFISTLTPVQPSAVVSRGVIADIGHSERILQLEFPELLAHLTTTQGEK